MNKIHSSFLCFIWFWVC